MPRLPSGCAASFAGWTDDGDDPDPATLRAAIAELRSAIDAGEGEEGQTDAVNAATALSQHLGLLEAGDVSYTSERANTMAANVARTVAQEKARGNEHLLLFAHNGHVDKTSAAFGGTGLGASLAQEYGENYRVIGTELYRSTLISGSGTDRNEVSLTNRTPLRGMFTSTAQGYLEFATATPQNQGLLDQQVPMASAGERLAQWQAWIPWFSSVQMVPSSSYDALVLVYQATPVTPL